VHDPIALRHDQARGRVVRARLDKRRYPIGKKVTTKEIKRINIKPDEWHGDWNYVIRPREKSCSIDFRIGGPLAH
jgi:Rhodopirellula transposase DDE domain